MTKKKPPHQYIPTLLDQYTPASPEVLKGYQEIMSKGLVKQDKPKFCAKCGKKLPPKSETWTSNEATWSWCRKCGAHCGISWRS